MEMMMRSIPDFIKEKNVILKDNVKRFGLIFPSTYDIGMGGMTIATLSTIVNDLNNWQVERFLIPWNPYLESISMEHKISLNEADILGFTAQFEVTYLALGWLLKKAGIPLDNTKRKNTGKFPPLVVGGPCVLANPFPLIDLVDGFFLGDAEITLSKFLLKIEEHGINAFWNDPTSYQEIEGFWSPHFLELNSKERYSELFQNKKFEEVAGEWFNKFQFHDLDDVPYPLAQIVTDLPDYHPYAPFKGKSFQLEIGRGCNHRCRFCMISRLFKNGRFRSFQNLLEIVNEGTKKTGVNSVDIFGTNLSEYPKLTDLCWDIVNQGYQISLATLRPDRVTKDLIEALYQGGQRSLTIATETGTERLRNVIGKPINDEKVYNAVKIIGESNIPVLKNFFLIGLPTETKEDHEALIKMVKEEYRTFKQTGVEDPLLRVDVNPFVPKWQTPFKNWVYNYLPENRNSFKSNIYRLFNLFDHMSGIKPKQTPLTYSLAQTWLTHLTEPINFILEQVPIKNHIHSTRNAPFFIQRYSENLDSVLQKVWTNFSNSNWEVSHSIKATAHDDKYFTNEYHKILE
jgi:radical SAM superfamily enzyme YgiQ (UPF0313 family)